MRDLIKKIPKLRGHGKNRARTVRIDRVVYTPVNLSLLEATFAAGDVVTPATLLKKGVIKSKSGRVPAVKILGAGELKKNLAVSGVVASASAKKAIESAGGSLL
jgi:large subunit ribosomal protein L15